MASKGRECRIEFLAPVWGRDAANAKVATGWTRIAKVWAEITFASDGEQNQGAQQARLVTHRFRVRYRPVLAALTGEDQAECEGRRYGFVGAKELTEVNGRPSRREWLEISMEAKPDIVA